VLKMMRLHVLVKRPRGGLAELLEEGLIRRGEALKLEGPSVAGPVCRSVVKPRMDLVASQLFFPLVTLSGS
jgi:hypothetical protein